MEEKPSIAPAAVRGPQSQQQCPFRRSIEASPKVCQGLNRVRSGMEDAANDFRVAQPIASSERVGEVQYRIVVIAKAGSQSALCPHTRCVRSERRPGQKKHWL